MTSVEELLEFAARLGEAGKKIDVEVIRKPLDALEEASNKLNASFSGSWLGYHSRVYYANLQPSPAGANFSQEWGLKELYGSSMGSRGEWQEFAPDVVKAHIFKSAGEGCSQFTNIEGLGQIRFPQGNIAACFDEIRQVLEREGLLATN
jgi:hypothetical protein